MKQTITVPVLYASNEFASPQPTYLRAEIDDSILSQILHCETILKTHSYMVNIDMNAQIFPVEDPEQTEEEFYFDIERIRVFKDCFYLFGITDGDDVYESHALTIDINGEVVPVENIEIIFL